VSRKRLPTSRQRVFNVSVKAELVPWWENEVEPIIKERKQTRTEFIMDAVRWFLRTKKEVRNG